MESLSAAILRLEVLYIRRALVDCNGNQRAAAGRVGISRYTLFRRLQMYRAIEDLEVPD